MAYIEDIVKATKQDLEYRLTLLGTQGAVVEGFKSMIYYSGEHIELRASKKIISLNGESMAVQEVAKGLLVLQGKISSVEVKSI